MLGLDRARRDRRQRRQLGVLAGAERADERRDPDRDRRQHQQRAEQPQPSGAGAREVRQRQADPRRERDAAGEREPAWRRPAAGGPAGRRARQSAAGRTGAVARSGGRRLCPRGSRGRASPEVRRGAVQSSGRGCCTAGAGAIWVDRLGLGSADGSWRRRHLVQPGRIGAARAPPRDGRIGPRSLGAGRPGLRARPPGTSRPSDGGRRARRRGRRRPGRRTARDAAAGTTGRGRTGPGRRADGRERSVVTRTVGTKAAWTRTVGTRAAGRWRWAAGAAAPLGRRRDDRAVGGCARYGGISVRGCRGRGSVAGCGRGSRRGGGLASGAAADPGSGPMPRPGPPRRCVDVARPRRACDAAAHAWAARRSRPRSTASGAGSRAARPAVRAASPRPIGAPRAGARSTSVQTSPSAQVVAARSA